MEYLDNDTYYDYIGNEDINDDESEFIDNITEGVDEPINDEEKDEYINNNVLLYLRNQLKCIEFNRKFTKIHYGDDIINVIPIAEFKMSNKFVLKTKSGDIIKVNGDDLYFD